MKTIMRLSGVVAITALSILTLPCAALADQGRVEELKFPRLNKLQVPEVDKIELDNGIRLYIVEDHSLPLFNISIRIAAGSYLNPAEKVGLAGLTGQVLRTGGTSKWSGDEIDERLESVGATAETSIGLVSGNAFGGGLIEYSDLVLETLSEILRNPSFDQEKIDLAKTQTRAGIARRNDNPMQLASSEFSKIIYGKESPYARQTEYATIDAVTRADLIEFHKKYIHPSNLQIAVWGDFKKNDIIKDLKKYFGDWKATGETAPPPPEVDYDWSSGVHYAPKTDVNQSNIYIGHIGGLVTDEDYPTRIVMNNIFGGGFGSRLFNNVRSREGLAYATGGRFDANVTYPGRFFGFASTKSETTLKAIRAVKKQMESMITEPPTEAEMSRSIDGYLNSFVFKFDTRSEVVNRMVTYDAYGIPADFLNQIKDKVEKVTPEQVVEQAKKDFQLDKLHFLVVGNGADFDGSLEELGLPVDTVDISIPSPESDSDIENTPENIEKGRALLLAAAKATGGVDSYKKIKSYSRSGNLTMSMGPQLMTMSATIMVELPDKQVVTILTPGGEMKIVFDGSQGWQTMGGKTNPLPETEAQSSKKDMARSLIAIFGSLDNSEYTPVYGGSGEESGHSVEYVYLIDEAGDELIKLALDATTMIPVSSHFFGTTMAGPAAIDLVYGDFTEVDGIKIPFKESKSTGGKQFQELTVSEMKLNVNVPADAFAKP